MFGRSGATFAGLGYPYSAAVAAVGYYCVDAVGTSRNSEIGGLRTQLGFLIGKGCREATVKEARG